MMVSEDFPQLHLSCSGRDIADSKEGMKVEGMSAASFSTKVHCILWAVHNVMI